MSTTRAAAAITAAFSAAAALVESYATPRVLWTTASAYSDAWGVMQHEPDVNNPVCQKKSASGLSLLTKHNALKAPRQVRNNCPLLWSARTQC